MTPQPSGRRYRSLRTHSTRFRNSHYPSTIRKEVQEPQDPLHQVQEQSLPLNHQEGGAGASGTTPPGSGTVITPQPSGRRYRSLRAHSTRSLPLNHQEGGTGASEPTPPGHYPSTIRKEVQEPQDPLHQVITPQPSGRRCRSLRNHSTRFRNSHDPSTIRKEVQEPQEPLHQVQEQSLPLNHQEGGTGASGTIPPGSGTVITPQPSGRRYRSLRAHSTRSLPLNHQEGGTGASGPTPPGHYPSTIRKEVQEPQDPLHQVITPNHQEGGTGASGPTPPGHYPSTIRKEVQEPQDPLHQVITPQPSGRRYRSLRTHSTRSLPLNHQEGGTGASGPTPPGHYPSTIRKEVQEPQDPLHQVITPNHQEGGTGASGPTELGSGTVITPQPSGRRCRSLRAHSTRSLPLNHQEGGTGASGPTPPGHYPPTIRKEVQEPQGPLHQVITPQPSGRRCRSLRTHSTRFRNSHYPQPSGRRYRSLRAHSTRLLPPTIRKEVQEPQGPLHQVITPQPSGRRYRSLRAH
ncbi:basic salivary proline-rich protein 1-like isoform X2 [Hypanus sabinus]|uniref:basic salivary proline-rich protein 1-like isoform X2 n=1 Tax=Hypanus sabinus TaxID=79690 RepID=UPI0028C3C8D4|nr:basic salivary proline-rich protein 1-like isoform X2 [Hypanus sabinus]